MKGDRLHFDKEELQILQDFERGEFESVRNFTEEKQRLEAAAKKALKKDKRINIRLSSHDLEKLKKQALKEGIPYQTLISSTLHKFATGRLKEAEND